MDTVFPGAEWQQVEPTDVGIDPDKLDKARKWFDANVGDRVYRVAIIRHGYLVAEWQKGVDVDEQLNMASATKSLFSSVLGIAIGEGKINSADDKLIDYFPQFMDVPEGKGPKPGRFAKSEDRDITFRQLISNTSGYMKPSETPGAQFHYQTFGMNICCHGIEMAYGLYDSCDPDRLGGINKLIAEKIRDRIGGTWTHRYTDFDHPPEAAKNIFGHSARCDASARDMGRMGLLWLHMGRWEDTQVIPAEWIPEATKTAPDIMANCPKEQWRYGYAFWTNDHGQLWPSLPRDSFCAHGAGAKMIWVCPSLDLIVAQSPGLYEQPSEEDKGAVPIIVAACM